MIPAAPRRTAQLPTRDRRLDGAMLAAGLAAFSLLYCTQAVLPSIGHQFGVGATAASLTISAATGALALAVLPVSSLAESVGRRRVMTVALFAGVVFTVLAAVAPMFWQVLLARILVGVSLAGVVAVAMGHVGDEAPPARVGSAMGVYVAGTSLGGLLGRLVPSGVDDLAGWRVAIVVLAAVSALAALVFVRVLPPAQRFTPAPLRLRHHLTSIGMHLRNRAIRQLCTAGFLLMGGFVAVYNYLGYRLTAAPFDLPKSVVGLVFIAYLAGTVSSAVAGRLSARFGRRPVLVASIAVSLVGLAVTVPDRLAFVIAGLVVFTAGFFGAHSVASGAVAARATSSRSQASALYLVAYYAGSSAIGALAGPAWTAGGWFLVVGVVAGLYLLAAAVIASTASATGTS